MSILYMAARQLSTAGYTVVPAAGEVRFEDASVLGYVAEFESATTLLDRWKSVEDTFLRKHTAALRRDSRKAWNVYSILLTPEGASDEQRKNLVAVEENFQATRKVARAGIVLERDVENALGVLLPIRHRVSLSNESALDLLRDRLAGLPPTAVRSLLTGRSGEDFADALVRSEESE